VGYYIAQDVESEAGRPADQHHVITGNDSTVALLCWRKPAEEIIGKVAILQG